MVWLRHINQSGKLSVPVIVRLQGTNAEEAKKIIDNSGLEVFSAISFREAAELVTKILNKKN
jgi:succinyl-CoA synthetase beta subunit